MELKEWLETNLLDYEILDNQLFTIDDKAFLVVLPKDGVLFDEGFKLILSDFEMAMADNVDYFAFCFGRKWYYYHKDENPELKPLKYIGKAKTNI